jgi:hypothetical protein
MMNSLYEADLRIERAGEHLIELENQLLRFERSELIEVLAGLPKEDPRRKEQEAKFESVWRTPTSEQHAATLGSLFGGTYHYSPPHVPAKVHILIGEIAYNLVAALDYLVFVLAKSDSGVGQDGTQFPVCKRKEFFDRGRNAMLKGVSDEHVALIERLQSYNGCTWTQRLKDISNLDKHRQLVRAQVIPLRIFASDANAPSETARDARLRRQAKLPKPPVKMYLGNSLLVTLADGSPIIKTLEVLKSQVADVLVQFKSLLN